MGRETVLTNAAGEQAGQLLQRRFTNVRVKRDGKWSLVARHASIIVPTN